MTRSIRFVLAASAAIALLSSRPSADNAWKWSGNFGGQAVEMLILGDIQVHSRRADPTTAFNRMRDTLTKADLVYANLEGLLVTSAGTTIDIPDKPEWTHPGPDGVKALKPANITVVGVANNVASGRDNILKSLAVLHNPTYKLLYMDAWRYLVLKASTSAVLARELGGVVPEQALLASLLSDVGNLVLLSAFMDTREPVSLEHYRRLCHEFGRSLGLLLLKRWGVEPEYIAVLEPAGEWQRDSGARLQVIDVVNLALYHARLQREPNSGLPTLTELSAWRKLAEPDNRLDEQGRLALIAEHREQVQSLARSFGG